MHKVLHLALDILFKNKFISVLIALQLAFLSFFTLNNAYSMQKIYYAEKVLSRFDSGNFAYFSPIRYEMYSFATNVYMENESDPYKCFNELSGFLGAENVYALYNEKTVTELDVYPRLLSKKLNIQMRRGKWLSDFENNTENGNIPCVTSRSDRKIGEVIYFTDDEKKYDVYLEVVGIAADPYFEFEQNVAGEELAFTNVVTQRQKTELDAYGMELLWVDSDLLISRLRESETLPDSRLLFFDSVSPETVRSNTEILKKSGSVLNFDTTFDNVRKQNFTSKELPQILSVWCISVLGFCCTLTIFYYKCKNVFLVYSVCGANNRLKRSGFLMSALITIIIALLPVYVVLLAAGMLNWFEWTYSFVNYGSKVLVFVFAIYALIAAAVSSALFHKKAVVNDD